MKIFLWTISIVLTLCGLIVSVYFLYGLSYEYTVYGNKSIEIDKTGQVGDFIGGVAGTIFSLAGFIVLLLTLKSQTKSSYVEQFESKFFELVRLHRDNVSEVKILRKSLENGKIVENSIEKRRAFKQILSDFIYCRNDIRSLFVKYKKPENIYDPKFLLFLNKNLENGGRNLKLISLARINIAYCIIFYGSSKEGIEVLKHLFKGKFKQEFITEVLTYIQMKPIPTSPYYEKWLKIKSIKSFEKRLDIVKQIINKRKDKINPQSLSTEPIDEFFYKNDYIKYYGGNQHRLGHYFRHLFQCIKYVNAQKQLTEKEKYFYAKTLRAQLSTYEQALLFINSLSLMGMPWELVPDYEKSSIDFINKKRIKSARLISKYNLIKNLPGDNIFGIHYKNYYPDVKFEIESNYFI
jgi:hypothetical protein